MMLVRGSAAASVSPRAPAGRIARCSPSNIKSARRLCRAKASSGDETAAPPADATVVPEPSYNIPLVLLAMSGLSVYENWTAAAAVTGILGLFLGIQASRVKFVFDKDSLEVVVGEREKTENVFVGGENRWSFSTFTNWEFWWPGFPVLVYFKETQTKPEGQIHFFPIIFNGRQLYEVMEQRCGSTQNSGRKD